jgi:hypothetical protein
MRTRRPDSRSPESTRYALIPTRHLATAALSFALAAVISCGGKRAPETEAAPETAEGEIGEFTAVWPRGSVVPVEIQNRHTLDLTIYITRSGKAQRIGMATAARSTFLRLPAYLLGPGNELTLMAHAIGAARRLQSERLIVMPGQKVVWTIDHGFETASSAVW